MPVESGTFVNWIVQRQEMNLYSCTCAYCYCACKVCAAPTHQNPRSWYWAYHLAADSLASDLDDIYDGNDNALVPYISGQSVARTRVCLTCPCSLYSQTIHRPSHALTPDTAYSPSPVHHRASIRVDALLASVWLSRAWPSSIAYHRCSDTSSRWSWMRPRIRYACVYLVFIHKIGFSHGIHLNESIC
jgi:hypothetical protein